MDAAKHKQVDFLKESSEETPESVMDVQGIAREAVPAMVAFLLVIIFMVLATFLALFIYSRVHIEGNWLFFLLYILVILAVVFFFYIGDRKKVGEMKNFKVGLGKVGIITKLGNPKKDYHLIQGDYMFANLWYWYGRWQMKLLEVINISYPIDLLFSDIIIAGGMRVNIKLSLLVKVINHLLYLIVETGINSDGAGGIKERLKDSMGSMIVIAAGQVSNLDHFRVPVGKEPALDPTNEHEKNLKLAKEFKYQNMTRFENLLWEQLPLQDEYHLFEAGKDNPDISAFELGLIIRSFFIKEAVDKSGKITSANESVIEERKQQARMKIRSTILKDTVDEMIKTYPAEQRANADYEAAIQRSMILIDAYTDEKAFDIIGLSGAVGGIEKIFETLGPIIASALKEAGYEKK